MTSAEELRAAAAKMRLFSGPAAGPLADWLEFEADLIERVRGAGARDRTERALAVARAIGGGGQP